MMTAELQPHLKPLFRYKGSKWKNRIRIASHFPPFMRGYSEGYAEPFLGSGAMFTTVPVHIPSRLNDLNFDLMRFYTNLKDDLAIADRILELKKQVQNDAASKANELFERWKDDWVLGIDASVMFFAIYRFAHRQFVRRWRPSIASCDAMYLDMWHGVTAEKLTAWHERLQSVQLTNVHFRTFLRKLDRTKARYTVFLDPPYWDANLRSKTHNNQQYEHVMTDDEHRELAAWCRQTHHYVVMTNSIDDMTSALYLSDPAFACHRLPYRYSTKTRDGESRLKCELIITRTDQVP